MLRCTIICQVPPIVIWLLQFWLPGRSWKLFDDQRDQTAGGSAWTNIVSMYFAWKTLNNFMDHVESPETFNVEVELMSWDHQIRRHDCCSSGVGWLSRACETHAWNMHLPRQHNHTRSHEIHPSTSTYWIKAFYHTLSYFTNSTAQGGGGSFKVRTL